MKTKKVPKVQSLWAGPDGEGPEGGVTQSLVGNWLTCRERARLYLVEGLAPPQTFSHALEYGNMWHVCEEEVAGPHPSCWGNSLLGYAKKLSAKYRFQQEEIEHCYNVCKVQFPIYLDHWSKHPDVTGRVPLLSEHAFDVPYRLPSGRTVRLRGKMDSVDLVEGENGGEVWLQENKTKGDVDVPRLTRQLSFDLQSMFYLVALSSLQESLRKQLRPDGVESNMVTLAGHQIAGVRYNVVKRPLSGGTGSIRRKQPTKSNPLGESKGSFYDRLSSIIKKSPGEFFERFNVSVTAEEIDHFRSECLDPILENLCDWYADATRTPRHTPPGYRTPMNWRHPYGSWNAIDNGTDCYADYLAAGSEAGLERRTELFPELPREGRGEV